MKLGRLKQLLLGCALTASASFPAGAGAADAVLTALYPCTIEFFKVLESHHSTFETATLKDLGTPPNNSKSGSETRSSGTLVTFDKAVVAGGLNVTAYMQVQRLMKGKPESFLLGFRVLETPEAVVAQIKSEVKEAEFRQRGPAFGWVQELSADWQRTDASLIETRLPRRMLLIEPSGDPALPGSTIRCAVHRSQMGAMTALPAAVTLFPKVR